MTFSTNSIGLYALAALAGLLIATVIPWAAPRAVAHRLQEPPSPPSALLLVPLVGGWLAQWRPWRTLAGQLATSLLFVGLAGHEGESRKLLLAGAYSAWLLLIAYIDLDHRLVLNRLSYPGTIVALAAASAWPGFSIANSTLGALVGLATFFVLQLIGRGALGTGDTKLAMLIGAMRGLPGVLDALLIGVVLGGVGAIFFLTILRRGRKSYMAYAPYLTLGAIVSFFIVGP